MDDRWIEGGIDEGMDGCMMDGGMDGWKSIFPGNAVVDDQLEFFQVKVDTCSSVSSSLCCCSLLSVHIHHPPPVT